jgi:hypothetical protein
VIITFDQGLSPGVLDPTNWTGCINGTMMDWADAAVAGATVELTSRLVGGFCGASSISYSAAVPDVTGVTGLPAASFLNYPVVIS